MFIDRDEELALLEKCYASSKAELFVLYGRRRVGKTALLTQFCQNKRSIFFVADMNTEQSLRAGFSRAINQGIFGSQAAGAIYNSWEDIFLLLAEHSRTSRLIVVLDEFTYLVSAYPPLASILQRLWDSHLKESQLMLILCGSYIGMMEEEVLGYKAPLYGRRTAQYLLDTLDFHNARLFLPTYLPDDQVRAYAVFGGSPGYLQLLDPELPLPELIHDKILTRGAFLYDEVRLLLQQELRQPRLYFAILEAIASGKTRLNEIKQATGIEGLSAYMDTLQSLLLVEREIPVTETQPHKSRRGIYRLKDNFFRFWFRFLHPNRSLLEQGRSDLVMQSFIMPNLDTFCGTAFEKICQQFLWQIGLTGGLPFLPIRIGGWWVTNEEIDLVATREREALLVECKWSSRPVGENILQNLERKATVLCAEHKPNQIWFGLCSRSGFTQKMIEIAQNRQDLLLFDLETIVNPPR